MAFDVKNLALSALSPVRFTYSYNSNEKLSSNYRVLDSGIRYYEQELLSKCADAAFSQQNAIMLTSVKDLKTVFENVVEEQNIQTIGASFYLSVTNTDYLAGDNFITKKDTDFFVGGKGDQAIFHVLPIENGIIELKCDNKQVIVNENYPFDLQTSDEPLEDYLYRQRFAVEIFKDKIALKTKTSHGDRYLSYGIDRKLRFVGLQLNDTTINEYLFTPAFISSSTLKHNFDPSSKEVRYYNEDLMLELNKNVAVKKDIAADTSLLVSCSLKDVIEKTEANVNISITKTNFSTSGTFNTLL